MDDMIFYLIIVNDITITVILSLMILLFCLAIIFLLLCYKNKDRQLKFLLVCYMIVYDVISFILPLIFVWWLAVLIDFLLIFVIRQFYEKQSIIMHFKQIDKNDDYKKYISKLTVVLPSSFISFMCGLLLYFSITLI